MAMARRGACPRSSDDPDGCPALENSAVLISQARCLRNESALPIDHLRLARELAGERTPQPRPARPTCGCRAGTARLPGSRALSIGRWMPQRRQAGKLWAQPGQAGKPDLRGFADRSIHACGAKANHARRHGHNARLPRIERRLASSAHLRDPYSARSINHERPGRESF